MRTFRPLQRPGGLRGVLVCVLAVVILAPTVVMTYAFSRSLPTVYTITGPRLLVQSGAAFSSPRSVALADVTDTRVVGLQGGRRVSGTSLPGLCTGTWRYPELGTVWQATDCAATGLLVRSASADRPWVISPPDPEDFRQRLAAGTETRIELPRADPGVVLRILGGAMVLEILVVGLLAALLVGGPRVLRYEIDDGVLHIRTIFGHRRLPLAGVRAGRSTPGRMRRVMGSAAPGYFTGLFRDETGSLRVYATDLSAGVMLQGEERVYVNPDDPDGFLAALAQWGATVTDPVVT